MSDEKSNVTEAQRTEAIREFAKDMQEMGIDIEKVPDMVKALQNEGIDARQIKLELDQENDR